LPRFGALGALLALVTCAEPPQPDYTHRHAIGARPETVTLALDGGGVAAFDALVAGYLDRGHGPLVIAGAAPPQETQAVRARLVAAGVPASAIRVEPGAGALTLRYARYDPVLPACGDWSAAMAFNPDNADYPAFGCAIQRDLGQMLADPADVLGMRAAAPGDVVNEDRVLRAYRAGADTTAKQGAIQDGADQNVATGSTAGAATPVPTATR